VKQHLGGLRDILERPDDDVPRLIYADWLEEFGDEADAARAEFIRLQCERARRGALGGPADRLARQAEKLLGAHWEAWVGPLRQVVGPGAASLGETWLTAGYQPEGLTKFRRGFVEVLSLNAGRFLCQAEALFDLTPLRYLRLGGLTTQAAELAACPSVEWLHTLDVIDHGLGTAGMQALAVSPFLKRQSGLGLYNNEVGDAGAAALAEARWLPGLRYLELGQNGLTALGAAALVDAPCPFRPLRLGLSSNPIGDPGAQGLATSPALSETVGLDLHGCGLGPAGVAALLGSPHLGALRYLGLGGNALGPGQREALRERFGTGVNF
jgi:uncharacterized protein (TIGR02996 family)